MKPFRGAFTHPIAFGLVAAGAMALAHAADGIKPGTGWHQPYTTLLDVDFEGTGFHARWDYFHCGCGDILVRVEQSAPDGVLTGELLLIDGQVLLARGFAGQAGDLEPLMQAPTLMLQTAFALLGYALPSGPAALTGRREIDVTEDRVELRINTGMASGQYGAPWTLTGSAWPGEPGRRRFDLEFTFANPAGEGGEDRGAIRFSGGQDYASDSFPLAPGTMLGGWRMQWLSKGEEASVEAPADLTIGELRAEAQALARKPS